MQIDPIVEKMLVAAIKTRKNAYAPYSKFYVGASVLTPEGEIFSGCNVENASYSITVCAEKAAISNLVLHGKKRISAVLVVGPGKDMITPCGACRQMIREFADLNTPIYLCDEKQVKKIVKLDDLLPYSFGPDFLNM